MEDTKVNIIAKHMIKSPTNDGDLAKQVFMILQSDGKNSVLLVRKRVLVNTNFELWDKFAYLLKEFKGYRLYERSFSIQLKTLSAVNEWLSSLTIELEIKP